jgi:hypothetical protein
MKGLGFYIRDVAGDGNCLFRSIADQLFNDAERHGQMRTEIVAHLRENRTLFSPFIEDDEPFDEVSSFLLFFFYLHYFHLVCDTNESEQRMGRSLGVALLCTSL